MTKTNRPISYNKQTPRELMMFTELIVDVWSELNKANWSNQSAIEIGFSLSNKITKSNIFFGIWFEAWESFEIPLCITIDFAGIDQQEKWKLCKKILEKFKGGLKLVSDYQNYTLILIEHDFFNFKDDEKRLAKLFKELCYVAGIKTF
jgi:hypothetical protein